MPKKPRIRIIIDSEYVKGYETLRRSARQNFCHIFSSLRKKISSQNCVLGASEILRLFVKILTPDDKCSLSVKASVWRNHFKCNYL